MKSTVHQEQNHILTARKHIISKIEDTALVKFHYYTTQACGMFWY